MTTQDIVVIAVIFVFWGGLCLLLMMNRGWKLTRAAFVMFTGFAIFFALAVPAGQEFLRRLSIANQTHPWIFWVGLVAIIVAACMILKVNES